MLFSMLNVKAISIECTPGPWSRRAMARGCHVIHVPFDADTRSFSTIELQTQLGMPVGVDLLFVDSPIGTANRSRILSQMLGFARIRYVIYHDVRRDLSNIFRDQKAFGLRLLRFVDSVRGLALFEIGNEAPRMARPSGSRLRKRALAILCAGCEMSGSALRSGRPPDA